MLKSLFNKVAGLKDTYFEDIYEHAFCHFFQDPEEGESVNDNSFKISCATYCSRTILDSAKQTK